MIPKVEVLILTYPLRVDMGYQLGLVIKLDGFVPKDSGVAACHAFVNQIH